MIKKEDLKWYLSDLKNLAYDMLDNGCSDDYVLRLKRIIDQIERGMNNDCRAIQK